jgi:molybdenum cofactor biosynthesis enzyme
MLASLSLAGIYNTKKRGEFLPGCDIVPTKKVVIFTTEDKN